MYAWGEGRVLKLFHGRVAPDRAAHKFAVSPGTYSGVPDRSRLPQANNETSAEAITGIRHVVKTRGACSDPLNLGRLGNR